MRMARQNTLVSGIRTSYLGTGHDPIGAAVRLAHMKGLPDDAGLAAAIIDSL